MHIYLFALEPSDELRNGIIKNKALVKKVAGPQTYLEHFPHCTLYLSVFFRMDFEKALRLFLRSREPIKIRIGSWHVFKNDPRTLGHTISYAVKSPTIKKFQEKLVKTVSPFCMDVNLFAESVFPKEMQDNIEKYGYPYVGKSWIPHFTIASVRKDLFESVWDTLSKQNPKFEFSADALSLYEIKGETHVPVKRFHLAK